MKKKVCIFAGYFPLQQGGAEYQAYLIANSLTKFGYDVFFVMFGEKDIGLLTKDGYRIYTIKINKYLQKFGRPFFLYYFQIKKILIKEKPDIVYRRMAAATLGILALLKKRVNFKLIWACSSDAELERFKISSPKNILDNFDSLLRIYGIKRADKILVQTRTQEKLLLNNFDRESLLAQNLHPLPKREINKKKCPIRVIWIANLKKLKQPEIFLELAYHFQNYPKVEFVMIGKATTGRYQKKIIKKMHSLQRTVYKGELSVEEVNSIISESHILINTSLYEGFSNTFIQAWMRKVPVISLNVDPDNMIKKNNIGFHSLVFDKLVNDTKLLIENTKLREDMGKRAQRFAIQNFSLKNIEQTIDLLGI